MSGFAKRPKSSSAGHSVHHEPAEAAPAHAAQLSYARPEFFGGEDDDDYPEWDMNSKKSSKRKAKRAVDRYDEETGRKRPNFFVRMLRAIFPTKGDGLGESVRKIIFDVAVVAFVISGGSVLYSILDEAKQAVIVDKAIEVQYKDDLDNKADVDKNSTPKELAGTLDLEEKVIANIQEEKPGIQPSFMELYNTNSDIVGWIRVGSANEPLINYPVVQAEDNEYYLTHNFNREVTDRGAVFADYRNTFEDGKLSANTVLYGHNMWNGETMFAKLSRYYDSGVPKGESTDKISFYKTYPTLTFNTIYENIEWKVFACVLFNTQPELGEVYPYINKLNFGSAYDFNEFILDIMDRSVLWTDVDLEYGDEILTLSTCYYPYGKEKADTRVAVFARKVREGEDPSVDVSKAQLNPSPLKFDYQYKVEGGSWKGRIWDTSKLKGYTPE